MPGKRPFTELYIHVPFCMGKCDYCAFYSEGKMEEKDLSLYLEKLFSQMEEYASSCGRLRTVYFGGGTPTLLPPEKMELLFRAIRENFLLEEDAEISMECNPETLTEEKCSVMKSFVNRASMGVQSFSPLFRERIGRRTHENGANRPFEEMLFEAVSLLKKHGIKNIGFDLIYLLPGETLSDWEKELKKALSFGITHLSCYSLSIEEGTPLSKRCGEQDEDLSADMWELAGTLLAENAFPRYEVSNYAREGFFCRHNDNIWKGASYLGLGPSGCSFDGRDRWVQTSPLSAFLAGKAPETDVITEEKRLAEMFIMGLRRTKGWNRTDWEKVSGGKSYDALWEKIIAKNCTLGLLRKGKDTLSPTEKGLEYWNDLAESFL